jgi:hypothetical protein
MFIPLSPRSLVTCRAVIARDPPSGKPAAVRYNRFVTTLPSDLSESGWCRHVDQWQRVEAGAKHGIHPDASRESGELYKLHRP